jgi:hypothetical protein
MKRFGSARWNLTHQGHWGRQSLCVGEVGPTPTLADLVHAASWSSSALASLRTGVSKPSVNQP